MAMSDFFGNGWDDPRSGQIMGLAEGLLSAPGGQGLAAGLRGMREARDADAKRKYMLAQMGMQDVQTKTAQAQLKEMERKNTDAESARDVARQFFGANGLPGASPAQPGTAPVGPFADGGAGPVRAPAIGLPQGPAGASPGQPTPAIALNGVAPKSDSWLRYKALGDKYAEKGLTEQAQNAYSLAEKFRPKYNTTPQVVRDPATGQLVNVLVGEDGSTQQMGYGVKPDMQLQSLGDRVQAIDKNAATNGQSFAMGQSPDSKASNAVAWANNAATIRGQNMTDSRARETLAQGKLQYDAERGIVGNLTTGEARPMMLNGAPVGDKDKPLTDTQSKALVFGGRMANANSIFEAVGDRVSIPGSSGGGLTGALTNYMSGPDLQKYNQAKKSWINANLRKESGAVIGEKEYSDADLQYFPQPFDTPEKIAQKKTDRELQTRLMLEEVPTKKRAEFNTGGGKPGATGAPTMRYNPATGKMEAL